MRRSIIAIGFMCSLNACADHQPAINLDDHMGEAYRQDFASQIVQSRHRGPIAGDGARTDAAVTRYEKGAVIQPHSTAVGDSGAGAASAPK